VFRKTEENVYKKLKMTQQIDEILVQVQGVPCQLQHKETTYFLNWKCYLKSENCIKKLIDCRFLLFGPKFCMNTSLALKEL